MKKTKLVVVLTALFTIHCSLITTPTMAQQKRFTLEDLNFGGTNYRKMLPKNLWLTWWGDRLMQQDAEQAGYADPKAAGNPLFTLKDIGEDWHSLMNVEYPYPTQPLALLQNGKERVLYDFKAKQIVWRQASKGQHYADWNKTSRAVAYVQDDQLCVMDAEGEVRQLTTDGSREIVYGQSVHRNEFGIHKGTFWSPDGQRLAFYRMDQSMVTDYPQVDIFPRTATYEPDKYPMAGMTSHKVTVGIYDLNTRQTVWLKAGDPTDRYFTNIAWSPDGQTVYMFELNRAQNDCRLVSYDATSGKRIAELYQEQSDKYVEPQHPIVFLPWDATKFIMQSQRDGYNHLYLYNKEGRLLRQLTQGQWIVMEMLGFNEKAKSVIIASNEKSPLQRNLYAVSIANGKRTPLDNGRGVHHGVLSASGTQLYDKYQEPTVPRCIDLVSTSNHKVQTLLTAEDPWKDYQQPIFESGSIKAADGVTDLYFRMVKPDDFDATKKYPTVVYVYGGPHAHNVDASWHWASR